MKETKSQCYSDSFYKTLLDNMQIGVIVVDTHGIVTYINITYARILSIDAEQAVGQHVRELVSDTRLHIVAKTGQAEINYPHKHNDTDYLVHRLPIKENDEVVAVLGLILFNNATTTVQLANEPFHLEEKPNHIKSITELFRQYKGTPLRDYLMEAEKYAIQEALIEAKDNKSRAANILGIHRTLLYRKMHKLGLSES